jgi:hypothetical protein
MVGDLKEWTTIARVDLTSDGVYVVGRDAAMFPTNAVLVY